MTMNEATTQAMIAEGPAIDAAVRAPNSHPDPMIEPSEAQSRPRKPTPRSIPSLSRDASGALPGASTFDIDPPQDVYTTRAAS